MEITMQMIVRRKEAVTADLDGELVMMDIDSGNYYSLGRTGSVIWDMLEHAISVEHLIEQLMNCYEVSRELCEKEVLDFLNDLEKEGFIHTV